MKLKNIVKYQLSRVIPLLAPSILSEIKADINPTKNTWLKKQIIDGRVAHATKKQNLSQLQEAHSLYWQGEQGAKFYGAFDGRFEEWFRDEHAVFEVELQNMMHSRREFRTLLEIGCGDGQVLNYLSNSLPGIDRGIGIDINSGIIEENRKTYSGNSKLKFVSGDAVEGIKSNMGKNCLVMSYGGVLEYFSEESVKEVFNFVRESPYHTGIALVEPISPDHDLSTTFNSYVFGQENSFSHNHEHLLKEAGFEIIFECEKHMADRWKIIVAISS
ncbi:MAG: class I SAM-dependent methyltransferase [Sneathiella sp.]|uniref:class I SAM-dependent methyltransferase n=1 Tax=Sneathiella sp. TaxID=1964365 RepID=UPI003003496B